MKAATGVVIRGKIELPKEFAAEGAQIVVLVPEFGEPISLSQAEERELLEAIEEIRRGGEYVDGEDLLSELRSPQFQDTRFGSLPERILEAAASMDSDQLLSVAYYTRIALEHLFTPEDLRTNPLLAGTSSEPSPEEQEVACQWLEEIQNHEDQSIDQLDCRTIDRYINEVVALTQGRWDSEMAHDPEEGRRLLEDLQRAVPWPPEFRKTR